MNVATLFEAELRQRRIPFDIDPESGRHALEIDGTRLLISLENLQRDFASDGDTGCITRFVDSILASSSLSDVKLSAEHLYWCLEPADHVERADFRVALSDCVDRVLVHLSEHDRLITWITPEMLADLGLSETDATTKAFANLARALGAATIESQEIDGVRLGFINTTLPFKASLILPNLREIAGDKLGWPLLAVVPDRDFLYLWAASHKDFAGRVGKVVVDEYSRASYPISTEVYEISDQKIHAIGEFPKPA